MRISVFGMGYVGSVTAACLAKQGHDVIGVDISRDKVGLINAGKSPVIEPSMAELVSDAVREGRLRATADASEAVAKTELSLVCVGTPSMKSGRLELGGVESVSREMGRALRGKREFHTFAIRSTILPGTIHTLVIPNLEAESGRKAGKDFAVCYNPEFIREGSAVKDFYAPPFTVIGADNPAQAKRLVDMYSFLDKEVVLTEVRLAEMLKYVCNTYHALKVAFANEMGTLAKAAGVDSLALMKLFCSDTKLNVSPAYLQPGFAFGGSCLPKDIRALSYRAKELDLKLPVLEAILPSNQVHVERAVELILGTGKKRVGVLGLSFKANTDDLRESPILSLVKVLLGEGCQVGIYDPQVELSTIVGANRQFVMETISHIGALIQSSLEALVAGSEVIVLSRNAPEFDKLRDLLQPHHVVIQLEGTRSTVGQAGQLTGLCW